MHLLALSQAEFGHIILQDIALICVIGIVLAGLIHGWLRKASPSLQWNQIGKVSTVGTWACGYSRLLVSDFCVLAFFDFSLPRP